MDESQKHEKIKETRHEKFHIVWIHLHETSRKGKTVETGKWLSEARVGVQRGIKTFWCNESILKPDCDDGCTIIYIY